MEEYSINFYQCPFFDGIALGVQLFMHDIVYVKQTVRTNNCFIVFEHEICRNNRNSEEGLMYE